MTVKNQIQGYYIWLITREANKKINQSGLEATISSRRQARRENARKASRDCFWFCFWLDEETRTLVMIG